MMRCELARALDAAPNGPTRAIMNPARDRPRPRLGQLWLRHRCSVDFHFEEVDSSLGSARPKARH